MYTKYKRKNRKRILIMISTVIIIMGGIFILKLGSKYNFDIYENNKNIIGINEEVMFDVRFDKKNKKLDNSGYLTFKNDSSSDDAAVIRSMLNKWNYLRNDGKKVVYLTFDDGPSKSVSNRILDILQDNNVKATFFILGTMLEGDEEAEGTLKRMVKDGHSIGNHGYCHKYDILYPNGTVEVNSFMQDIKKTENIMKNVLGKDFNTRVIRFPGGHGSWDTKDIDTVLKSEGYVYIDWNTVNGDGESNYFGKEDLLFRLHETIDELNGNDETLVILMHDTDQKDNTVESLQDTIDYLKESGYEFRTIK